MKHRNLKTITTRSLLLWLVVLLAVACFEPARPHQALAPAATPTPTVAPTSTSTPTPTVAPTSTPTPRPAVGAAPAEAIVRAYFEALAAQDFERARALTTGQARETTDQFVGEIEQQARAFRATPSLRLDQLSLGPTTVRPNAAVVHASFALATAGRLGPLTVPGPTVKGEADFTVEQAGGELKISRFEGQINQE